MLLNMSENKDPAIKLFGRTIQLGSNSDGNIRFASEIEPSTTAATPTDADCQCTSSDQNILCSKQSENRGDQKTTTEDPIDGEEQSSSSATEESKSLNNPSASSPENSKPSSNDKQSSSQDLSKTEDHSSDQTSSTTTHSQDHQNPPKKPDKILPCPRCSSMDTKFCYFNNYNVNQPRHFCKNCQRYWTAGGTMRNVPVGAGRRKNKNSSASQNRHLLIPDHPHNGFIHHTTVRPNGTILAFGGAPDSPLTCESMVSSLNLADKSSTSCVPNGGFIAQDMRIPIYFGGPRNGKENSNSDNSISTSLPYAWNPIPWQSGLPVSFIAAPPYLACNNTTGNWNMQFLPTSIPSTVCPTDQSSTSSSSPNSPLGKHARDGTMLRPSNSNKDENSRVVIPKTLRIDDPIEAAKSSIWDTLGIKKDKAVGSPYNMIGGFFGGLQPSKDAENNENGGGGGEHQICGEGSSMVLQANPAAFSRSLSFHEGAQ